MKLRGGEFSTGTTGNFQPELTHCSVELGSGTVGMGTEAGVAFSDLRSGTPNLWLFPLGEKEAGRGSCTFLHRNPTYLTT
jgi:hypothetical protein